MFGETTVERPLAPTSVREVGYYWLGAGVVAATLVGLSVESRIGLTTATVATVASVFFVFAVFGGAMLLEQGDR